VGGAKKSASKVNRARNWGEKYNHFKNQQQKEQGRPGDTGGGVGTHTSKDPGDLEKKRHSGMEGEDKPGEKSQKKGEVVEKEGFKKFLGTNASGEKAKGGGGVFAQLKLIFPKLDASRKKKKDYLGQKKKILPGRVVRGCWGDGGGF